MKYLIITLFFSHFLIAESPKASPQPNKPVKVKKVPNIEIQAKLVKYDKKYLYMVANGEELQIARAELTKEGVRQILKNKDKELTLFIPETSIKNRTVQVSKDD